MAKKNPQDQARIEQEYNNISDTIIGYMPFGQFYGLMQTASKLGESTLKKNVCIDSQGRLVTSYKTTKGKLTAAWLKPQHELLTEQAAKKKYGKALLGSMPIVGQIARVKEQKKMESEGRCFDMTIEEFMAEKERREKEQQQKQIEQYIDSRTGNQANQKNQTTLYLIVGALVIAAFLYGKNRKQ